MSKDFISDEEMQKLDSGPDFISDEEMDAVERAETPSLQYSFSDLMQDAAGTGVGGAAGAGAGAGIQSIAAKGVQKAAEKLGPYTPEQLSKITQNYDEFKSIDPERTMAGVEDKFRSINRIANEAEKQAYANLDSGLSRDEYRKAVIKSSLPFTKDVPIDTPEFYDEVAASIPKRPLVDPLKQQYQRQLEQFATLKAKERVNALKNANLGTLPEEQLLQEFETTKAQVKANPEGFSFVPDQGAADLNQAAQKAQAAQDLRFAQKEAIQKLQTPLAKEFPELTGKMYSSTADVNEAEIKALLGEFKYGDKLSGEEAYQMVRQIREAAFKPNSQVRSEAAKAVQKELRSLVGSKNPEASAELQKMSEQIEQLKKLEKSGYLKRDKSLSKEASGFVQVGEKQAKQIAKDVAPNLFDSGVKMTDDAAQRLSQLKSAMSPEEFSKLELALLKEAALDPRKQLKIGAIDTITAMFSPITSAVGLGTKATKTPVGAIQASRLADTLSQFKGITGKLLPGALGAAGAAIGASRAAQAGEISPEEAAVLGTAEALNPTPLDVIGAYTEGKKEFQKSGSVPSTVAAGAKGAAQPLVDLAKLTPEIVEAVGTQKSLDARTRMEQNMNAFKSLQKKSTGKAPTTEEIRATQEWFSSSTDPVAQNFVQSLEKAVNAPDERTRAANMFALEQQPAFRELQRKRKLQE